MEHEKFFAFERDFLEGFNGCYLRNPESLGIENTKWLVPLSFIDYNIQIVNGLAQITITQTFFNPIDKFLSVFYSLPTESECCYYLFEARFNNTIICGKINEKEMAKKEYEKAKGEGHQAALGYLDNRGKDIFNFEIGNIPPKTEFVVTLSFLKELELSLNTFYKLVIPAQVHPRCSPFFNPQPEHLEKINTSVISKPIIKWGFKINLHTTHETTYYNSQFHNLTLISQNLSKTETLLVLEKPKEMIKDLVFSFATKNSEKPSYVLGTTDISSTLLVSFIPKFCQLNLADARKAEIEAKGMETDLENSRGEYIFLFDRSGSMGGSRIEKAKEALILFLKSLPLNSYFNIISFGSESKAMFEESQENNTENIEKSIQIVEKMTANLGGTEILKPLEKILNKEILKNYPRHVFLLTDGEVFNCNEIIKMIKMKINFCRVHSIGIGNGVSMELIKECAKAGKGKFIFVEDQENPSEKIIELLEETLSPLITHISLSISENEIVDSIIPNPENIPYILKNDTINFYITFKEPLTKTVTFKLAYSDPITKEEYSSSISVEHNSLNFPFVDKMAHFKILRNLENLADFHKESVKLEDFMYYVKVTDFKKKAIEYSVQHQILSKFTAFLSVNTNENDKVVQEFKDKGAENINIEAERRYERRQVKAKLLKAYSDESSDSEEDRSREKMLGGRGGGRGGGSGGRGRGRGGGGLSFSNHTPIYAQNMFDEFADNAPIEENYGERKVIKIDAKKSEKTEQGLTSVEEVIRLQNSNGSWDEESLISNLGKDKKKIEKLCIEIGKEIVITKLIIIWLERNYNCKQYSLILKKAKLWLRKELESKMFEENKLEVIECI